MAETGPVQSGEQRGGEAPRVAPAQPSDIIETGATINPETIDAFVQRRRAETLARITNPDEDRVEAIRERLRAIVAQLPQGSPERSILLEEINNARTLDEIINLAAEVRQEVAEAEGADMQREAIIEHLSEEAAAQKLIHGHWDFSRQEEREDFARAALGVNANDPDAVRVYAQEIEDPNSQAGRNARAYNAMPEEGRAASGNAQDQRRAASRALMDDIIAHERDPSRLAVLRAIRGNSALMGREETFEALDSYDENPADSFRRLNAIKAAFDGRAAQVQADRGVSPTTARRVVEAEYNIDTLVNQRTTRARSQITSLNVSRIDAGALSTELALITRETDPARRATAIRTAFTHDWERQHPGVAINQASLDRSIQQYMTAHPPSNAPVIPLNQLIGQAMENGAHAMFQGRSAQAQAIVNQIYDAMRAPNSGYTLAQAQVARDILTQGNDLASHPDRFLGLGRQQLIEVMSDPNRRAELIRMTIDDINHSTPGHLRLTAQDRAIHLGRDQTAYDLTGLQRTDRSVAAHDVYANINDSRLDLGALGISRNLSAEEKLWELRNKLTRAGVILTDSNGDHHIDVNEINTAIRQAARPRTPAPAH